LKNSSTSPVPEILTKNDDLRLIANSPNTDEISAKFIPPDGPQDSVLLDHFPEIKKPYENSFSSVPAVPLKDPYGEAESLKSLVSQKDSSEESPVPLKSGKIVGGSSVERGQYPFMVSLMHTNTFRK
jgi:hypothetical protein